MLKNLLRKKYKVNYMFLEDDTHMVIFIKEEYAKAFRKYLAARNRKGDEKVNFSDLKDGSEEVFFIDGTIYGVHHLKNQMTHVGQEVYFLA